MEDAAFVIQSSSSPSSAMHDVDGLWENIAEIRMKKLFRSCRGRCKMSSFFSGRQRRAEKPVQQCKARDQNNYPYPEDNAYSDCAIESKKSLSFVFNCIVHPSCMDRPKIEKSDQKKRQIALPHQEFDFAFFKKHSLCGSLVRFQLAHHSTNFPSPKKTGSSYNAFQGSIPGEAT